MDKFFQTLGLAAAARKVVSGEMVLKAIRSQNAKLVIVASDASEKTKKMYTDKCLFYNVELMIVENSQKLSNAIGKQNRMALAVLDKGFSIRIKENMKE